MIKVGLRAETTNRQTIRPPTGRTSPPNPEEVPGPLQVPVPMQVPGGGGGQEGLEGCGMQRNLRQKRVPTIGHYLSNL